MFTDQTQALEAERLLLTPNSDAQVTAASRTVARNAHDKADLAELLDAVGLPGDEDAVTALLPLLPSSTPDSPGDPIMTNTRETTALSMHRDGRTRDEIREATGLPAAELAALLPSPTDPSDTATETEDLLGWAEQHSLAGVRSRAVRIRSDLADLTERRTNERAVDQAETEVARIAAELEQAKAQLKAIKSGSTPTVPTAGATPTGARRSKEESTAIRIWARENGYQVGSGGIIKKEIVAAYEAASPAINTLAEAS